MQNSIRWGIAGLGRMAEKFIPELFLVEGAEVTAVASRNEDHARSFAQRFNVAGFHGSYQNLFEDPEVDVVYIATPHDSHANLSIAALEAGKHVLCEKPMALDAVEAQKVVDTSVSTGNFYMEAMWSRFIPGLHEVIRKCSQGAIGEVHHIEANFAFHALDSGKTRLFDPNRGGGSLLDIGIYPVFLAYTILGIPEKIHAVSRFGPTGVELETAMILEYPDAQASLFSSLRCTADNRAVIYGSKGSLLLPDRWIDSVEYILSDLGGQQNFRLPFKGKGYVPEILAVHEAIRKGSNENDLWSHKNCLDLISILDRVREVSGIKFPP